MHPHHVSHTQMTERRESFPTIPPQAVAAEPNAVRKLPTSLHGRGRRRWLGRLALESDDLSLWRTSSSRRARSRRFLVGGFRR
jgi:hypothetical protein